jgi:hypothetical protein
MKDKCVMCKEETPHEETDHIDMRYHYVEGCGQLCAKCWKEVYPPKQPRHEYCDL